MLLWSLLKHDGADSPSPLPSVHERQWVRVAAPAGRPDAGAAPGEPQAEVRPAANQEAVHFLRGGDPHPAVHVQRGGVPPNRWVKSAPNSAHSLTPARSPVQYLDFTTFLSMVRPR